MGNFLALLTRNKAVATQVAHAPPMSGQNAAGKSASNHLGIKTVIADGSVLEGDLRLKENIIINGTVVGNVIGENCLILIKESGLVTGAVHGEKVYLAGEIRGGVHAHFLRLFPTSRIAGSIGAEKLVVDMGASLHCTDVVSGAVTIDQPGATTPSSARAPETPSAPLHVVPAVGASAGSQ